MYQSGVFLPVLAYFGLPLSRKFRFLDAAFKVSVQVAIVYFCRTSVTPHCAMWHLIPDDWSHKKIIFGVFICNFQVKSNV